MKEKVTKVLHDDSEDDNAPYSSRRQIGGFNGPKLSGFESFRALKFSSLGHFLTLKHIGKIGGY